MEKVLLKDIVCKDVDCKYCPYHVEKNKAKVKICMSIKLGDKLGNTLKLAKELLNDTQYTKVHYYLNHRLVPKLKRGENYDE